MQAKLSSATEATGYRSPHASPCGADPDRGRQRRGNRRRDRRQDRHLLLAGARGFLHSARDPAVGPPGTTGEAQAAAQGGRAAPSRGLVAPFLNLLTPAGPQARSMCRGDPSCVARTPRRGHAFFWESSTRGRGRLLRAPRRSRGGHDRPQGRGKGVGGATARLLAAAYDRFEADDEARVLVLTGAGGVAFCAGADLKSIDSMGERLADPRGPLGFSRVVSSKPTIAAISGWCLAGGFELALWCDLRVATAGSKLGFTERRFGVPLIDGGTQRLPRIVGLGRALDLILSGRIV